MEQNWISKQVTHEDFPLLIRYPENQDITSSRSSFPELAVITHHFSKVRDNGLPDPDYNDTLLDFDKSIREAFESIKVGLTVCIETFAGKRNYYIYTIPKADIAVILEKTLKLYPQHKISWLTRSDPAWSFIEKYSNRFLKNKATNAGEMPT